MPLVSIVVPVYHNAASLPELLAKFRDLAANNPDDDFEFVFVDDGSRDESFAVLTALAALEPRMRVVKLSRNFGSNPALLAGLDQARGDVVAAIAADLQDPPELIHDMLAMWREGRKVAIATVVQTWGSSPRPAGSQLVVDDAGNMLGSVSGGCIEGAVVKEAQAIMNGAKPRLLEFGVSNEQAWEVGLACGGRVQVYVEALS